MMYLIIYHEVTACRLNNRHIQEKHRISLINKMLQRVG
jgi:hypothetical protein